jgi:hypothetical protein
VHNDDNSSCIQKPLAPSPEDPFYFHIDYLRLSDYWNCGFYIRRGFKGYGNFSCGSLTGHIALGAPSEEAYGIFGSEVPIVSDYEGIPQIDDGKRLFPVIKTLSGVESYTSIISGIVIFLLRAFLKIGYLWDRSSNVFFGFAGYPDCLGRP